MNGSKWDVVVVGGGIGGWIAANYAARAGKRVLLAEKADAFGGRAATVRREGTALNLGAHAIYRDGELPAVLKELGITLQGGIPSAAGYGVWNGGIHPLPGSPATLLSSKLLNWGSKLELARAMTAIKKQDERKLPAGTLGEWAERNVREPQVRHLIYALARTSTYAHQPDIQLAGPVLRQLKRALNGGVLYVDGGWGSIIGQLRRAGGETGQLQAVQGKTVERVSGQRRADDHAAAADGRFEIRFADGDLAYAEAVILAVPPAECCRIVEGAGATALDVWRRQARPVTAACLDLVMRKLTQPRVQFAIGIDSPFLFTNQSRAAKLSHNGLLAVSVLKYHGASQPDAERDIADMERMMDLLQPGWRDHVAARQHLPRMTVVYDHAHTGRIALPGPAVPEMAGLYVAGDWAGHGELLADAAAASAKRAAEAMLQEKAQHGTRGGLHGNKPAV